MTTERKPVLWSCDDGDEELIYTDMDEAIEYHLDSIAPAPFQGALKVYGYAPCIVSPNELDPRDVVEGLLERLDEYYGSPDHGTPATQVMLIAAKGLCEIVIAEYKPWGHDIVETVEVDVLEWVKEHRPDWLGVEL